MGPTELQRLPQLPSSRVCPCGGALRWSHLEYLGSGRTLPLYICAACGLAYRGQAGERAAPAAPPRRQRPMPDGGHPDNPVLDSALAERLRELLK
ncbi:MAG: hypothetical protein ACYDEA_06680 [Candidatus Dormibacteria bacterium]